MLSNRARRVLIATLFNVLFEYSIRGLSNLGAHPALPVILLAAYASLFTLEDALIQRFRLKDYHLTILAFTYGPIYQALISGAAFVEAGFLGINWGQVLFTVVIWWGMLQSIVTFYLANRLAPRDTNAPAPGRATWVAALLINLFVIFLFSRSGRIPTGRPLGYGVLFAVSVLGAIVLALAQRGRRLEPARPDPSRFLDVLVGITVAVFLVAALFLTGGTTQIREASLVNMQAARAVTLWTIVLAVSVWGYRLIRREPIPV